MPHEIQRLTLCRAAAFRSVNDSVISGVGRVFARIAAAALCCALLSALWCAPAQAAGAQYVYDAAGRLVQVIAPDGTSAIYTYDLAGNLLAITPVSASTSAVSGFSAASAAPGSTITIYGSGFSTTPADNHVLFNGVAATVIAATANTLTVIVPATASTGRVTVTDSHGTVRSAATFAVSPAPLGPAITAFSPRIGVAGTAVTIDGSHFQTSVARNKVSFAGVGGTLSTATSSVLRASVPAAASSGKISVATPYGTASSSSDFFVAPAGATVASVASTGRVSIGGAPLTVVIASAHKIAMVLFDGELGQQISLQTSGNTFPSEYCNTGTISLMGPGPNNTSVGTFDFCTGANLVALPQTGTYTLIVTPNGADTGKLTIRLQSAATVVAPITIGGAAVTVATTVPAQQAQLNFTTSSANQVVSVEVSGYAYPSSCLLASLVLTGPAPPAVVGQTNLCAGANAFTLPIAGSYSITVQAYGTDTGHVTIKLQNAPTVMAAISIGGAAVTVTTTVPAQIAQLTFKSSSANQIVSVEVSAYSVPSDCYGAQLVLTGPAPANPQIGSANLCAGATAFTLPTVGTYTLTVQPYGTDTGHVTIKLQNAPTVMAAISIGGAAVTVTTTVPAQIAQLTFKSRSANQIVSVEVSAYSVPSDCYGAQLVLTGPAPANPQIGSANLCDGTTAFTLTTVGTYVITVEPNGTDTGSVTVKLE
jgi:YD repeat-containing protein